MNTPTLLPIRQEGFKLLTKDEYDNLVIKDSRLYYFLRHPEKLLEMPYGSNWEKSQSSEYPFSSGWWKGIYTNPRDCVGSVFYNINTSESVVVPDLIKLSSIINGSIKEVDILSGTTIKDSGINEIAREHIPTNTRFVNEWTDYVTSNSINENFRVVNPCTIIPSYRDLRTFLDCVVNRSDDMSSWVNIVNGEHPWVADLDNAPSGYPYGSLRSKPNLVQGNTSSFVFTVTGPGTLSFYWKCSSYSMNYVRVYVDGTSRGAISGTKDWESYSCTVTGAGNHTITLGYVKTYDIVTGDDCGWVTDIKFVPT